METRRKPQLLVLLTLFILLFSQTLAWPLLEAPFLNMPLEGAIDHDDTLLTLEEFDILPNSFTGNDRNARHTEEILTSDYKRLLGQLPAKRNAESFIGKEDSDNISEDKVTTKRHADAMLTDRLELIEKQKALRPLMEKIRRIRNEEDAAETYRKMYGKQLHHQQYPQWKHCINYFDSKPCGSTICAKYKWNF